jgi:hypothetical protein
MEPFVRRKEDSLKSSLQFISILMALTNICIPLAPPLATPTLPPTNAIAQTQS